MNMDTAAKLGSYIARGPVFVPKRLNKHPDPNQAAPFQDTQKTNQSPFIFFLSSGPSCTVRGPLCLILQGRCCSLFFEIFSKLLIN